MSGTCDQPCLDVDLEDFENIGVGDNVMMLQDLLTK